MSLSTQETSQIIRYIFKKVEVESSSDFIEILYEIYKRVDEEKIVNLSPIREIEENNWRIGISNVEYIKSRLRSMVYADLVDAEIAYKYVINELFHNEAISKIYELDEEDRVGWIIFNELREKKEYTKRLMLIDQTKGNT